MLLLDDKGNMAMSFAADGRDRLFEWSEFAEGGHYRHPALRD